MHNDFNKLMDECRKPIRKPTWKDKYSGDIAIILTIIGCIPWILIFLWLIKKFI